MVYKPLGKYAVAGLRQLTPEELEILLRDAKKVSLEVRGSKMIRKIIKDKANMRRLLNGFDSIYNEAHRCSKDSR